MKLILDENIPVGLVGALSDIFEHVKQVGLLTASDDAIWHRARQQGLAVITQDKDFSERSRNNQDVKVVWVRYGNCSIRDFQTWLLADTSAIQDFLGQAGTGCLVLHRPTANSS